MELKIQNATFPTVFIGSHPNFMRTLLTMGGMQASTRLGNWLNFTKLMSLWNFNIGVNGKTLNVEFSKTAGRRAKQTKIWDSGYCCVLYPGLFIIGCWWVDIQRQTHNWGNSNFILPIPTWPFSLFPFSSSRSRLLGPSYTHSQVLPVGSLTYLHAY